MLECNSIISVNRIISSNGIYNNMKKEKNVVRMNLKKCGRAHCSNYNKMMKTKETKTIEMRLLRMGVNSFCFIISMN